MASAETEAEQQTVHVKVPPNAFWLFLEDNRTVIEEEVGTKATTVVSKEASKKWKALSDTEREEFRKRFVEIKAGSLVQYPEPTKFAKLADPAEAIQVAGPVEAAETAESAKISGTVRPKVAKNKRKQPEPRPLDCAFWLFLGQSREDIIKTVGSDDPQSVAGVALEMWTALPAIECVRLKSWAVELKTAVAELPAASGMCINGSAGDGEEHDAPRPPDARPMVVKRTLRYAAVPEVSKKQKKNPPGVFSTFLQENRASIEAEIGSRSAAMVIKAASDKFKALSEEDRSSLEARTVQRKSASQSPAPVVTGASSRSGGGSPERQDCIQASRVLDSDDEAPLASRRQSVKPEAKPKVKKPNQVIKMTTVATDVRARPQKRVKQPQATQAFKAAVLEAVRNYIEENPTSWSRSLMIDELSEKHCWEHDMYLDTAVKAAIKACGHEGLGAGVPKATNTV